MRCNRSYRTVSTEFFDIVTNNIMLCNITYRHLSIIHAYMHDYLLYT